MNLSELAKTEVKDLIGIGQGLVSRASQSGSQLGSDANTEAATWIARTGQLLQRLYGVESFHRRMFDKVVEKNDFTNMHSAYYSHLNQVIGLLRSVEHELENELIFDFRRLLQADIFADFLEMAKYLLDEHYKDAAAVLIGGVLEDSLRELADANGIVTTNPKGKPLTIEPLNAELTKAGAYDKLIQKQVTSWANLRNDAAHGHYDKYDQSRVQMMLLFVQKFTSDYLR